MDNVAVVGLAYHANTLLLSSMLFLTLAGSAFSALRRVVDHCRFIQNSADVLKNVPSRIAVSPVMPLSSLRIAVIRFGGTPIAFARALAVRPSGFKNSMVENFSTNLMQAAIQPG
jgi:hypothetical protein